MRKYSRVMTFESALTLESVGIMCHFLATIFVWINCVAIFTKFMY